MTALRQEWSRDAAFIAGRWQAPRTGVKVDVENPATEETVGTSAECGVDEVNAAVAAAQAAFPGWSAATVGDRVTVLRAWLDRLRERYDLLVDTTVAEVGAPVTIAQAAHVDLGLAVLGSYLDAADDIAWEERVGNSLVLRESAGVAGCITPWNYPFYQVLCKIGGALVAGSPVVLKPAEITPLSAYLLVDAAIEAGLPGGILNLIPGRGSVVGEALVVHPGVDVVSFTGSTGVGARIAARAAANVTRVALELGGKSASIVLHDADLDEAITGSIEGGMLNSGQTCSAWSRLLVPRSRLAEALEMAAAAAGALTLGDPRSSETWLGPVVTAGHRASVTGFVERALADGARLVAGGTQRPLDRGHFVSATVLTDVAPDAEIVREEVFGPVVTVQAYDDEEDAVAMANASNYGLHGAVWSGDRERALQVARRLRTGQVDVNGGAFNPAAPFGGYGRSGNGRELGRWGIEEFLEVKSVQL